MPPPPARGRGNGEVGQSPSNYGYQGYFNGAGYSSYGGRPSAADAHYFAHITNAMDINTHDTTPSKKEIHHVRLPRQGPIRVNRHIHDWEDKQQTVNKRISNDSDHIYESLDEVARNRMKLAETRAPSRSPAATRHILSRDETNGSTGSRASMRGRELPAIPI
uniref:Uncharacterized protein n=1 Tax=Ciona savignyi TaxID=51511 RepID=H2Z0X1_CIOSA